MVPFIASALARVASKAGATLMLTGGRTAATLYRNLPSVALHSAHIFMSDERCVPEDSTESNAWLVRTNLFDGVVPANWCPIHGDAEDPVDEAVRYGSLLPEQIDLLVLSVGEDGHIASLFPSSSALESRQKVTHVTNAPKYPPQRITITPKVISASREVIVMAAGQRKGEILVRALLAPDNYRELPVRLTIGRTWVLDAAAHSAFQHFVNKDFYDTRIIYA
jgi:6-phosphogluconolactonase